MFKKWLLNYNTSCFFFLASVLFQDNNYFNQTFSDIQEKSSTDSPTTFPTSQINNLFIFFN